MCERAAIAAALRGLLEVVEEGGEQAEGRESPRFPPGMTAEEKAKAERTLLSERGPGQLMVLPEHMPLGPVPHHSQGGSLLGFR